MLAAWPLLQQAGRSARGRFLLSESVGACEAVADENALLT